MNDQIQDKAAIEFVVGFYDALVAYNPEYVRHSSSVNVVALTCDGKYVISGSFDNTLKIWNWQNGEVIASFTGESAINCCAVAPDGVKIVAGNELGRLYFLRLQALQSNSQILRSPLLISFHSQ